MCRLQTIDLLDLLFIMSKVAEQPTILRGEDTNINSNQTGCMLSINKKLKLDILKSQQVAIIQSHYIFK